MIDLILAATAGAIAGSAIMRRIDNIDLRQAVADREFWRGVEKHRHGDLIKSVAEHERASAALSAKQARIDRALSCETPKAAHGVRKMARLLRGEEA